MSRHRLARIHPRVRQGWRSPLMAQVRHSLTAGGLPLGRRLVLASDLLGGPIGFLRHTFPHRLRAPNIEVFRVGVIPTTSLDHNLVIRASPQRGIAAVANLFHEIGGPDRLGGQGS